MQWPNLIKINMYLQLMLASKLLLSYLLAALVVRRSTLVSCAAYHYVEGQEI